jgi:surface protein
MFSETVAFNQPIGNWNTAKVTSMNSMFSQAIAFNQPIGNWNTTKVTNMNYMFWNAKAFNQKLCWSITNVTTVNAFSGSLGSFLYYPACLNTEQPTTTKSPTEQPTTTKSPTEQPTTNQPTNFPTTNPPQNWFEINMIYIIILLVILFIFFFLNFSSGSHTKVVSETQKLIK